MIITLEHYFLWFLFYSFVGWMYESILVSCQQHRLVNRGFLNGPLCPEPSTTPTPPRPKINAPSRQTRPWRLKRKFE